MTQDEIKTHAEKALEKVRKRRTQLDVAALKLRAIQAECSHPNQYRTSCMGEFGTHCPDCGWST